MRLFLARHRRALAVCVTLTGLWITIRSAAPQPPPTVPVLVAARDLPAGRTLTSDDLRPGTWPADHAPSGRLTAAIGRKLASPIRTGELVTDARVVGPGLLAGQAADTVAVVVRLGDPAVAMLVKAGDRVDVLVSSSSFSSSSWLPPSLSSASEPSPAEGPSSKVPSLSEAPSPSPESPASSEPEPEPESEPEPEPEPESESDLDDGTSPSDHDNQSSGGGQTTTPDQSDHVDQSDNREQPGSAEQTGDHRTNSTAGRDAGAERIAAGALVLAVPGTGSGEDGDWSGSAGPGLGSLTGDALSSTTSGETSATGLLVLAVSSSEARRLAAVQTDLYIGIVVLPQP